MRQEQDPLTREIIGAAIDVHITLGQGLWEGLYEDAMCIELEERNLRFVRQQHVDVMYRGRNIGDLYADIVVENEVILELKSVESLNKAHFAQLMTYMKLMSMSTGLLINFTVDKLTKGIKRVAL